MGQLTHYPIQVDAVATARCELRVRRIGHEAAECDDPFLCASVRSVFGWYDWL